MAVEEDGDGSDGDEYMMGLNGNQRWKESTLSNMLEGKEVDRSRR